MNANYKVSSAVMAILSAHAGAAASAAAAAGSAEQSGASSGGIEEVIVTAQRRTESVQDVPITIQALTGDTLAQLNVTTFEDSLKFLPNVNITGSGPGQDNVIMRGLATTNTGTQAAGVVGSFPNVALYLDEQSGQLPGRNLDIYVADLERIEILEGPQGTLFGAGAQAGIVRYITNKPKLNVTEASVDAGYAHTAHGDPSNNVDAMLNLPVIPDTLAVRAVAYNDNRGGYINNIPATFARLSGDKVVRYFGGAVPPNSGPINNNAVAGNAFNSLNYKGYRLSALYHINDAWSAWLMQAYQSTDNDGVFWEEEYDSAGNPLPPLSVALYNPTYNHDRFEDTQLTLNGRIGALKLVYSGGYLQRNVDEEKDTTDYSRGFYAGYYQCNYPGYPFVNGKPTPNSPGFCYSPSGYIKDQERATHQSHELRLSTPDDWRVRAIGGLFWENYTIHEQTDWSYGTSPNFSPVGPPTIDPYTPSPSLLPVTSNNPDVRPSGDMFFDDITRGYKQKAAFGSVDLDLIPRTLTLTAGTRYYHIDDFEKGSNVGSFGCEIYGPYDGYVPPNPCISTPATGVLSNLNNLDAKHLQTTYKGFKSRGNLTWHVAPDALVYYTWSQGFRPGGFNRAQSIIKPSSPIYGLFVPPLAYGPDTLINNELGWKTEWLGRRLQWNGAVYREDWKEVQITVFDPGVTGNLIFTTNGPAYRVKGLETSLVARATEHLTIWASAAWNTSEVVKTLNLVNPATGQPINIVNPFGALGSPLADCPPFEGSIRIRYELPLRDYQAFWQVAATRQGGSYASTDQLSKTYQGASEVFYDAAFTTYDASAGLAKGAWALQLYGSNLTNERAQLFSEYISLKAVTINRPRTVGLRFSYRFGESK